jgi:hypothetical protein
MSDTNESSVLEDSSKGDTNNKEETLPPAPFSPRYPGSLPLRPPVDPKFKAREDVASGVGDVYLRKDGKLVRRVKKRASSTSSVGSTTSGVSSYASFDSNDDFSMESSEIYTRADGKKVRRVKKMKDPMNEVQPVALVSTENTEVIVEVPTREINSVSPEELDSLLQKNPIPALTAPHSKNIDEAATMLIQQHTHVVGVIPSITDEPEPVISFMCSSTEDDEPEPNVDGLDSEPEPVVSFAPTQESEPDLKPIYSAEQYTKLAYSLDPEMYSLDPDMNSLDPEMNSLDPEMNSLDPEINSFGPDINSFDPEINSLDPVMNMTFSAAKGDPVKVKSRSDESILKPIDSQKLKNPWLVDPSFSEDDENLLKLTMLQILSNDSLESSAMASLATPISNLPVTNPFDNTVDKVSLQHVKSLVSPTLMTVVTENAPGKKQPQKVLWPSESGTVLHNSPDQSLYQLSLPSPDEIVRAMTDAASVALDDAASPSRTPKGSYKSNKESESSPTQTSQTKSFEYNPDKYKSAESSSTMESRRTRAYNPLQISLSKSLSYSTNANTTDHYTTDNDTVDLYSTDERSDSWTRSPDSVPRRSLQVPEVLAASTRSRMIDDVSPSNTHTSLFTGYDSSKCAC